jgi:hypothetical protein
MKRCVVLLAAAALLNVGCTVGPRYKRPTVAVPGSYRGAAPEQAAQPQIASLGD